jgi:hypothetical protein
MLLPPFCSFGDVLFGDGFDEETRASDVVLVIHVGAVLIFREDNVFGPRHGSIIRTNRNKKRDNRVAYLRMGTPVTVVSLNTVYQTGNIAYRRRRAE